MFTFFDMLICILSIYFLKKYNYFQACDSLGFITMLICVTYVDFISLIIGMIIWIFEKMKNQKLCDESDDKMNKDRKYNTLRIILLPQIFNCVMGLITVVIFLIILNNGTDVCRHRLTNQFELQILFWCYIIKSYCVSSIIVLTIICDCMLQNK